MRFRVGYQIGIFGLIFLVWLALIIAFAFIRIAIFLACVFVVYVGVRWVIDRVRYNLARPVQGYESRHRRPHRADDGSITDFAVDSGSSSDSPVERSSK